MIRICFWRYLRFEFSIGNLAVSVSSSKAYSNKHLAIATLRAPDAISPRQCPTKKSRLAIATLRTPDARSAQSKSVIVCFQSYAPTLRCRYVATTRLIAEKDYVTAPSFRPQRGFAALAKCFRLDTASSPTHPRSDVATWQQRGSIRYHCKHCN